MEIIKMVWLSRGSVNRPYVVKKLKRALFLKTPEGCERNEVDASCLSRANKQRKKVKAVHTAFYRGGKKKGV